MNSKEAKQLLHDAQEALKSVGEKHGVQFSANSIRYSSTEVSFRVWGIVAQNGSIEEAERKKFAQEAHLFGLDAGYFHAHIHHVQLGRCRITGINRRAKAYPVIIEREKDGKAYKMSAAMVRTMVEKQEIDV